MYSSVLISHYHAETCVSKTTVVCPPPPTLPWLHLTLQTHNTQCNKIIRIKIIVCTKYQFHFKNLFVHIGEVFSLEKQNVNLFSHLFYQNSRNIRKRM